MKVTRQRLQAHRRALHKHLGGAVRGEGEAEAQAPVAPQGNVARLVHGSGQGCQAGGEEVYHFIAAADALTDGDRVIGMGLGSFDVLGEGGDAALQARDVLGQFAQACGGRGTARRRGSSSGR